MDSAWARHSQAKPKSGSSRSRIENFSRRAQISAKPIPADAQKATPAPSATTAAGYTYLKPHEAEFIEAVADHMVPLPVSSSFGTMWSTTASMKTASCGLK